MKKQIKYYKGNVLQIENNKYIICKDVDCEDDAIICLKVVFDKDGKSIMGNEFINIPNNEYNVTTDYVHETVLDFSIVRILETNQAEYKNIRKILNIK